jgi:hypothetical protein
MSGFTSFGHDPSREAQRGLNRRQSRNQPVACGNIGQLLGTASAGGDMIVYFAQPFITAVIQ